MAETSVRQQTIKNVEEMAKRAFADHRIDIVLESGVHRHYRCFKPGTGIYNFNIVTFPGDLVVTGDVGSMGWHRCHDMFAWAPKAAESISYFAEKLWIGIEAKDFDPDVATECVEEAYKERKEFIEEAHAGDDLQRLLADLDVDRDYLLGSVGERSCFQDAFRETWGDESPDDENWDGRFLWCREAVRWFFRNYAYTEVIQDDPYEKPRSVPESSAGGAPAPVPVSEVREPVPDQA